MLYRVSRFFSFSLWEQLLFLEAWILLGFMRLGILLVSFRRLTSSLCQFPGMVTAAPLAEEQRLAAIRIGRMITLAASHTPWQNTCLCRVLAAGSMLKRRKIAGVFFLGITRDEGSGNDLAAHAWLQCDGILLTGGDGVEAFTVLTSFQWGAGDHLRG